MFYYGCKFSPTINIFLITCSVFPILQWDDVPNFKYNPLCFALTDSLLDSLVQYTIAGFTVQYGALPKMLQDKPFTHNNKVIFIKSGQNIFVRLTKELHLSTIPRKILDFSVFYYYVNKYTVGFFLYYGRTINTLEVFLVGRLTPHVRSHCNIPRPNSVNQFSSYFTIRVFLNDTLY